MSYKITIIALFCLLLLQSCSTVKVINSWKADSDKVEAFKKKNVLVIARTSDNNARIAFEREIAAQLRAKGIKATESYTKAPKIYPNKEITEERVIFITVIKDKEQTTSTTQNGVYFGASYSNFYPAHYGSFYNYYSYPYAYGSYYDSFGGYIPVGGTSTRTYTKYVLETIAYNLDQTADDQIVAVVTSNLDDPNNATKTAKEYVDEIMKSLE
jgi:hypothetical protein